MSENDKTFAPREHIRGDAGDWLDARNQGLKFSDDKTVLLECVNKGIQSVVIPESVTKIGESAFSDCSSLTSVTIPEGVTEIGERAFYGCSSLTSVTIPEGVTRIGDWAFKGCSSLTSVTIPESVTRIGDKAFYGCSSLTSVDLLCIVDSVGKEAFAGTPCEKELREKYSRLFSFLGDLFT